MCNLARARSLDHPDPTRIDIEIGIERVRYLLPDDVERAVNVRVNLVPLSRDEQSSFRPRSCIGVVMLQGLPVEEAALRRVRFLHHLDLNSHELRLEPDHVHELQERDAHEYLIQSIS